MNRPGSSRSTGAAPISAIAIAGIDPLSISQLMNMAPSLLPPLTVQVPQIFFTFFCEFFPETS